jgi:hypothetical protein
MTNKLLLPLVSFVFLLNSGFVVTSGDLQKNTNSWKAGVARADITPVEPIRMSGYAGRDHACSEMLHPLWVKALALEDKAGKRAVLVTMDLALLPREMCDEIKNRLLGKYNLSRSDVILSWSHTHTGPVVSDPVFYDWLNLKPEESAKVDKYSVDLGNKIVKVVGEALNGMVPVKLYSGNGVTRFAVNRRNNTEASLTPLTPLAGPVDHSVPVLKVTDMEGKILTVLFGYACHSTTLGIYQWSGDYPGFAQIELEKTFPGISAMFFAGTGADQNPLPRRTVGMARQHGKTLAAAVEAVVSEPMRELTPVLKTAYEEIDLPYTTLPGQDELKKIAAGSSGYKQKWASRILTILEANKSLPQSYPCYPLQIWKLGEQNLVVLGGEVVVEYSLILKQIMGNDLFVMSYANDEVFYIPSARVLREGGYEGTDVLIYTDRPSTWKANIESLIINGVLKLAEKAGIALPESKMAVK